jgi:Flp pilus assembly protein TadD
VAAAVGLAEAALAVGALGEAEEAAARALELAPADARAARALARIRDEHLRRGSQGPDGDP